MFIKTYLAPRISTAMFAYSFRSNNSLLRHLVISGKGIERYFIQPQTLELEILSDIKLLENVAYLDNESEHRFLHSPFIPFSSLKDSIPHKHYEFTSNNRYDNLKKIANF